MSKDLIRTWKYRSINESSDRPQRMTEEEKSTTLEAVSKFNEYTQHIYKTNEIKDMVENIRTLAENASKMAIEETADWFDVVSVKRDTKAIGESVKIFESTAKEIGTLQQRMESVFEDIGGKLGKYYEIKELKEEGSEEDTVEESAAQEKYQKFFQMVLAKFGVKSPAELDDKKKKAFFNYIDKNHKSKNESTRTLNRMLEGTISEGFATWKMSFADMNLSGVELRKEKVYTVKARSTVEAIKKASKMAGIKGDGWMATQTHKLEKVG
jgi:hypothetical protein